MLYREFATPIPVSGPLDTASEVAKMMALMAFGQVWLAGQVWILGHAQLPAMGITEGSLASSLLPAGLCD